MVFIDPRIGSKELIPFFAPYDVPIQVAPLEFADLAHLGNGVDEDGQAAVVRVGYERKVITDMVQSMRDKRFQGHQLPGLMEQYDVVNLVIEGIWQVGDSGAIEVIQGGGKWSPLRMGTKAILFRELDHFIATLQHKRGLVVRQTANKAQTVAYVVSRFKWWNDKQWHQHRSDEGIYTHYQPIIGGSRRGGFARRTVPKIEKMVAMLDGFDASAKDIGAAYPTMEGLMGASVPELARVKVEQTTKDGKRVVKLGEKKAAKLWCQLREP